MTLAKYVHVCIVVIVSVRNTKENNIKSMFGKKKRKVTADKLHVVYV